MKRFVLFIITVLPLMVSCEKGLSTIVDVDVKDGLYYDGSIYYWIDTTALANNKNNVWVVSCDENVKSVDIPSQIRINGSIYDVTIIDGNSFSDCSSLSSITIPNSVYSIGSGAFYGCKSLTSIFIPESITRIGITAFSGCSSLTSMKVEKSNNVYDSRDNCNAIIDTETNSLISGCINTVIPNSILSIGDYAFSDCDSLTSINIPNSVNSIGQCAFGGCSKLSSIIIPESVTSIGSYAFEDTPWFVNQPNGLIYAGSTVYCYKGEMPNGTNITIKDGIKGIAGCAFDGCRGLTSIYIPKSVTNIGNAAFSGCSSLTSIVIPNSVTSMGMTMFYYCYNLTSITLSNSITKIESLMFAGCNKLTSIIIPESVTSIEGYAFRDCINLREVVCKGMTPPSCSSFGSFDNVGAILLYVPKDSKKAYQESEPWKNFKVIIEQDF